MAKAGDPGVPALLAARFISNPSEVVLPLATGDPFLIVSQRPNTNIIQSERTITAQTGFAQDLDFFGLFGGSRVHFHIFNNTVRGSLFVRFSNTASLANWTVKVPPQHSWSLPQSWGRLQGKISGIWDVADGNARTEEWF